MGSEPTTVADSGWDLLARVAAGDGGAFEPLVVRHQDRLLRVCERMLGDVEEARDAAQEAFLKLYRNASSFRPRGQLFTLLYRIAVNHCLNRLRRRNLVRFLRFSDPEESDQPAIDPPDGAPDAGSALASRERWRLTRKSIDALPPNQRAVLILIKAASAFRHGSTLESPGLGLLINAAAGLANGAWAWLLISRGRAMRSIALEADGWHLMTDVITSAGVIVGLILAVFTGWYVLDPLLAGVVAVNILWTGYRIALQSMSSLMDQAASLTTPRPRDWMSRCKSN